MFRTLRLVHLLSFIALAPCAVVAETRVSSSSNRSTRSAVSVLARINLALIDGDAKRALSLLNDRTLSISETRHLSIEGRAHLLLRHDALARRKLRSAVALRPDDAVCWYWLGRAYQAGGSAALAASSFDKAHWHGLQSAELFHHCAEALRDAGRVLGVLSQHHWPPSDTTTPKPGTFAFDGLLIEAVRGRPGWWVVASQDSALYQIHKALAIEPNRGDSLLLCGELWATAHHEDLAVDLFQKAANHLAGKSLARCHEQWAQSLFRLSDFDGFLKHTRTNMRLSGQIDNARLARCYDRAAREAGGLGDLQRQLRYLKAAADLEPSVDRMLRLADALFMAKQSPRTTAYLHKALAMRPTRKQRRRIKQYLLRTTLLASPAQ